jgi:hypothetical protein
MNLGKGVERMKIQNVECNRGSFMDEKLWAGVELKLLHAEFSFRHDGTVDSIARTNCDQCRSASLGCAY